MVSTFAGSTWGYKDATGTEAQFNIPTGVAVDSDGNLYVADTDNHRIRKITSAGVVSTLAGSGARGHHDAIVTEAEFAAPAGVAVDSSGNLYVADRNNHCIRKITPRGVVTTIAGDDTTAQLDSPNGVAVDSSGNLYVADTFNNRIRKITPEGVVSTFPDTTARFNEPRAVAVDSSGNLYVADGNNNRIRKIEYK